MKLHLVGYGVLGLIFSLSGNARVFAHGGDATLVHACIANVIKTVRIVGPNENCSKLETPRHWSITGPQGPQGIQGPPGPSGTGGGTGVYVETNGVVVGPALDLLGNTARPVPQLGTGNKLWLLLLSINGIADTLGGVNQYFTSSDCSGAPFFEAVLSQDDPNAFANTPHVFNNTIVRSTGPIQQIAVLSLILSI
jgi:hypothetical protein